MSEKKFIGKYFFDFLFSLLCISLILLLLVIICICIKINSMKEPIFFFQERIGQFGNLFKIIKFRSMKTSMSNYSTISIRGDQRITKIGSFLRKYKLDELPELFNILKGDMSFVGPRPDVPGYMDKLTGNDKVILKLRPGLTGPASLKYINEEEILAEADDPKWYNDNVIFPDKVRINRLYYENWSFWLDLKIIVHTLIRKSYKEENYFKYEP